MWRQVVAEMRLAQRLLGDTTAERAWAAIAEHIQQAGERYEALHQ